MTERTISGRWIITRPCDDGFIPDAYDGGNDNGPRWPPEDCLFRLADRNAAGASGVADGLTVEFTAERFNRRPDGAYTRHIETRTAIVEPPAPGVTNHLFRWTGAR